MLLWLLHQKGLFDPLYDWWEGHVWVHKRRIRQVPRHDTIHHRHHHKHANRRPELRARHHKHDAHSQRSTHQGHRHNHSRRDTDYYLHHVHRDNSKHKSGKKSRFKQQVYLGGIEDYTEHHRHRKEKHYTRTI